MKKLLLLAIFIASPLMGQETIKEQQPLKTIVSLNYLLGFSNSNKEYNFQMGANAEFILGKKWHLYSGFGFLWLDEPNFYTHTGLGVTLVDTVNNEGIGWMFDWNIITGGFAVTLEGSKLGMIYTSNLRARYSTRQNYSIQIGLDTQFYALIPIDESVYHEETTGPFILNVYTGLSVGFAFGR